MPRSVTISTPIPTLEEVGKRLGLSKRRQRSLLRLMRQNDARNDVVVKRNRDISGSTKVKVTVSRSSK